jgi:transcriptional regulator of acetoin/glycerol metabolism
LDTQAKLLRVIEQHTIRRLGELKSQEIDVQFVASIQGSASAAVKASRVRSDLFFRLGVGQVFVRPLRDRPGDLRALIRYETDRLGLCLDPAAERALLAAPWTGNIRELLSVLARVAVLSDTGTISEALLCETMAPDHVTSPEPSSLEARSLKELCNLYEWDTTKVAAALQVSRATVYRHLDRLGIRRLSA